MILDLVKIGRLAQDCSPQDLHAAFVWQQRCLTFNGQAIIRELHQHPHLWRSFFFMAASDGFDREAWSLDEVIGTLVAIATHRAAPATRDAHGAPYPVNALYVLAANQETIVAPLVALGKQWGAAEVNVHGETQSGGGSPCRAALQVALQGAALSEDGAAWQDAVVLAYWWYHGTLPDQVESKASDLGHGHR